MAYAIALREPLPDNRPVAFDEARLTIGVWPPRRALREGNERVSERGQIPAFGALERRLAALHASSGVGVRLGTPEAKGRGDARPIGRRVLVAQTSLRVSPLETKAVRARLPRSHKVGAAACRLGRLARKPRRVALSRLAPRLPCINATPFFCITFPTRLGVGVGVVLLPPSGLADRLARPRISFHVSVAPPLVARPPLGVSELPSPQATRLALIGERPSIAKRPSQQIAIRAAPVLAEKRELVVRTRLTARPPRIAVAVASLHAAGVVATLLPLVSSLVRGGKLGRSYVAACAIMRLLLVF